MFNKQIFNILNRYLFINLIFNQKLLNSLYYYYNYYKIHKMYKFNKYIYK